MNRRTRSHLYYTTVEYFRALDPNLSIHARSQLARAAIDQGLVFEVPSPPVLVFRVLENDC